MKTGNKELLIVGGAAAALGVLALLFLRGSPSGVYGLGPSGLPGGSASGPVSTGALPDGGLPTGSMAPFSGLPPYGSGSGGPSVTINENPWGAGNPYSWVNPGFPDPPTIPGPSPISLTVHGSTFAGLAPYMPLFGFVGVDTTQFYQ